MSIKVYQKLPEHCRFFEAGEFARAEFEHVADVETDSLEVAYTLTNSIHSGWWTNPQVTFHGCRDHGMKGCRSTSVGDVMEIDGKFHEVASAGFKPVEAK